MLWPSRSLNLEVLNKEQNINDFIQAGFVIKQIKIFLSWKGRLFCDTEAIFKVLEFIKGFLFSAITKFVSSLGMNVYQIICQNFPITPPFMTCSKVVVIQSWKIWDSLKITPSNFTPSCLIWESFQWCFITCLFFGF